MVDNVVNRLMELGLSEYESRAWLSLVRSHPRTAYETARESGIPTAKIYMVLDRLVERGFVLEISTADKKRYVPCEIEDFLSGFRLKTEKIISSLEIDLERIREDKTPVSYVWNLEGRTEILSRAETMIRGATSTILISVWKEEYISLLPVLQEKETQGLKIAIVFFGDRGDVPVCGSQYQHPIADTLYQERGGRGFALVTDGKTACTATIPDKGHSGSEQGAWSRSTGFVLLAEDYIKHDIYIMKIVSRFDEELSCRFGERYRLLRDIYKDKEVQDGVGMD
ncbi:MAG TPA: helix-turn-helix domain-containing protein [Treponemataceae bacterium]|nr:helix-turn-helix domain-containing protein [Treponemataceae bacterium]